MFKALGRSDVVLKLEIVKRIIGVISITASIPFGVLGMCIGYIILYVLCFSINTWKVSAIMLFPMKSHFLDILPVLFCSVAMGGIVFMVQMVCADEFLKLVISVIVGMISFLSLGMVFAKNSMMDAISLLRRR